MNVDSKMIQELKEKLLWKYKGDPIKKKLRKLKRDLKSKMSAATVLEAGSAIATNKFLIEPIDVKSPDIKNVEILYPDREKYKDFVEGKIPFTVLRSDYLDNLRSDKGKLIVKKLQDGILKSGDTMFVGNTDLPKVLLQEVLDQFVV